MVMGENWNKLQVNEINKAKALGILRVMTEMIQNDLASHILVPEGIMDEELEEGEIIDDLEEGEIVDVKSFCNLQIHACLPMVGIGVKRKLDQFLQQTPMDIREFHLKKPVVEQSFTMIANGLPSSPVSCSISFTVSEESSKQSVHNTSSFSNSLSFQVEADSSSSKEEVLRSLAIDDYARRSSSPSIRCQVNQSPAPRSYNIPLEQEKTCTTEMDVQSIASSDDSVSTTKSTIMNDKQEDYKPEISSSPLNFIGDDLSSALIPVGPRFQADIPEWTASQNKQKSSHGDCSSDDSKWLGTQIWPIVGRVPQGKRTMLGMGRPSSCQCESPGSTECTELHIFKERSRLLSDLGSAFFRWKFNEMGERFSKSWTLKEQTAFENLVKTNPVSEDKSFWKPALMCFPYKTRESIVSYYFNVFVLRRMRNQTRLVSCELEVDSDDDESIIGSKDVGMRNLTGL